MLGFETILPFLRPIEHLIRDDSISEIMVNGSAMSSSSAQACFRKSRTSP